MVRSSSVSRALLVATAFSPALLLAAPATLDGLAHSSPFGGQVANAAGRTDMPLEFRSILVEGGEQFFSLYEVSSRSSLWVGLNESGNPYKVQSYDANKGEVSVEYQGRNLTLPLKQAKVVAMAQVAPPQPAAPGGTVGPGGLPPNAAAANPAQEAARLAAVREEILRRRALRSMPAQMQPGAPGSGPVPMPNAAPGQGPQPARN